MYALQMMYNKINDTKAIKKLLSNSVWSCPLECKQYRDHGFCAQKNIDNQMNLNLFMPAGSQLFNVL